MKTFKPHKPSQPKKPIDEATNQQHGQAAATNFLHKNGLVPLAARKGKKRK